MEVGHNRDMMANEDIAVGSNSYEKVEIFIYLGLFTNYNSIHKELKFRLKAGKSCYYSFQTLLSSRILTIWK